MTFYDNVKVNVLNKSDLLYLDLAALLYSNYYIKTYFKFVH